MKKVILIYKVILAYKEPITLLLVLISVLVSLALFGMLHKRPLNSREVTLPPKLAVEAHSNLPCDTMICELSASTDTNPDIPANRKGISLSAVETDASELPWKQNSASVKSPATTERNMKTETDMKVDTDVSRWTLAIMSGMFVTTLFLFYYLPLRFFVKRAGYALFPVKLYVQGFVSMMAMVVFFSGLLVLATQMP